MGSPWLLEQVASWAALPQTPQDQESLLPGQGLAGRAQAGQRSAPMTARWSSVCVSSGLVARTAEGCMCDQPGSLTAGMGPGTRSLGRQRRVRHGHWAAPTGTPR